MTVKYAQSDENSRLGKNRHSKFKDPEESKTPEKKPNKSKEIGGPKGLEPTRYGDWEANGRCYDF